MNDSFLPSADPSTWLGVMGGGQLGRMFAHAAQSMGYKVAVLEPSADCPAGQVADRTVEGTYDDAAALGELRALCAAVTTEFENVPADSLQLLAEGSFVAPGASCVSIAQDRIAEKRFFVECAPTSKVMPAPHKTIASHADIDAIGSGTRAVDHAWMLREAFTVDAGDADKELVRAAGVEVAGPAAFAVCVAATALDIAVFEASESNGDAWTDLVDRLHGLLDAVG